MIQLKVYQSNDRLSSTAVYLELYDTEPIRLTLSIEDITNAEASSVFSKTFRVPATRDNNEFFQNAYEIDGIDFDVTTKKPADILVDGAEFRQGHVRLQKIYVNGDQDKIDYELLFLGETRDFASRIGDARMCDLNMDDLLPPNNQTNYSMLDIEASWEAFPQGYNYNSGIPPTEAQLTQGLADGNILFPLIDHGNTYDNDGVIQEAKITLASSNAGSAEKHFNKGNGSGSATPLEPSRFKPMIRSKRILDQIFENAGYSYESEFLNSPIFRQQYTSAFGNNSRIGVETEQSSQTIFFAREFGNNQNQNNEPLILNDSVQNAGGNYDSNDASLPGGVGGSSYTISVGVTAGQLDNFYVFQMQTFYAGEERDTNGNGEPADGNLELWRYRPSDGTEDILASSTNFEGQVKILTFDSRVTSNRWATGDTLQTNDLLFIKLMTSQSSIDNLRIEDTRWQCTSAPGPYYPTRDLDCDYKQIDFVKDLLTSFRLIFAPKSGDPTKFIIEPWQDYIGSGQTYDWSKKLVENKDFTIDPLFFSQSETIEFKGEEDEDYINLFHQEDFKHVHGWLRFSSDNELLKGDRKINVSYSPTPVDQIQYVPGYAFPEPTFIIPQTHKNDNDGGVTEHLPIKPNTRMLFYNGRMPIPVTGKGSGQQNYWFATGGSLPTTGYPYWPLVSMYSQWPNALNTNSGTFEDATKLEFSNDTRYFLPLSGYGGLGGTLYSQYWSRYISSLYNKFSRRVTATFILNNVDLQEFAFNDVIFVNGKYYRPEKIIDAQIGERTEVKVQLITLKDQRPIWLNESLSNFSVTTANTGCAGSEGIIQITTDGTPDFTWNLLDSGASGVYTAATGAAPYIFSIPAPVGTDNLTVIDSLGRSAAIQVTVPQSTSAPVTSTYAKVDPTVCSGNEAACNGTVTVTPSGGVGPYTIVWTDSNLAPNTFSRSGLCEGSYQYTVTDSTGCDADMVTFVLDCDNGETTFDVQEFKSNCNGTEGVIIPVSSTFTQSIGDVVVLAARSGCWKILQESQDKPEDSVTYGFNDCALCQAAQPNYLSWKVESCDTPFYYQYVPNNSGATLSPGLVIELVGTAADGCYEVIEETTTSPTYNVTNVFQDCATCDAGPTEYIYFIEACDGSFGTYATSTLGNITVGTIMQITPSGTCVSVGQLVTGQTPIDVLDDSSAFIDCDDCNGITPTDSCIYITGTSPGGSNGTYTAAGFPFTWTVGDGQTIVLCGDDLVITSGTVTTVYGLDCGVQACAPPENFYKIENCEQQIQGYAEQDYSFQLGDVVQYKINNTGATYCGTIIDIGFFPVTPDYVLQSPQSYECDDTTHCQQ